MNWLYILVICELLFFENQLKLYVQNVFMDENHSSSGIQLYTPRNIADVVDLASGWTENESCRKLCLSHHPEVTRGQDIPISSSDGWAHDDRVPTPTDSISFV
jgi:hypothetical protein